MSRLIITIAVILIGLGVVLAATGFLRFRNSNDESGITLDKKELKEKSQEAVQKTEAAGGKILDPTSESLQKAVKQLRGSSGDKDSHAAPAGDEGPRKNRAAARFRWRTRIANRCQCRFRSRQEWPSAPTACAKQWHKSGEEPLRRPYPSVRWMASWSSSERFSSARNSVMTRGWAKIRTCFT